MSYPFLASLRLVKLLAGLAKLFVRLDTVPGQARLDTVPGQARLDTVPDQARLDTVPGQARLDTVLARPGWSQCTAK